jgi:hypothetical protein
MFYRSKYKAAGVWGKAMALKRILETGGALEAQNFPNRMYGYLGISGEGIRRGMKADPPTLSLYPLQSPLSLHMNFPNF